MIDNINTDLCQFRRKLDKSSKRSGCLLIAQSSRKSGATAKVTHSLSKIVRKSHFGCLPSLTVRVFEHQRSIILLGAELSKFRGHLFDSVVQRSQRLSLAISVVQHAYLHT